MIDPICVALAFDAYPHPNVIRPSERQQEAVSRREPVLPMGAVDVADVGGAAVGIEPQQLLEIDGPAFCLELLGAPLRRITQPLLRRRHPPAREH
jgi:hypothetical protein